VRADHTEIYERFTQMCPGVQLPADWDFLPVDENCRFVTDSIDEVVELLQQEFEADRLLESRLLVRAEDEQLGLSPRLLTEDQLFFLLRNEQGQIFDIITSAGSLSRRYVLCLLRQDVVTQRALDIHERIFLVFSMVDVLLLRSLGLAAMHAAEMANLGLDGFKRLLWLVGGHSMGSIRREGTRFSWEEKLTILKSGCVTHQDDHHEFEVVICAFSLSSFSRKIPAGIASVARHLAHAEKYLDIHFDALFTWWPTEDEMSNLEFKSGLCDPSLLRDYLAEEHEFFGVEQFTDPSQPPDRADTFVRALEDLLRAFDEGERNFTSEHYCEKEREAYAKYEAVLDEKITKPILESALALSEPSIRPVRAQLAHVSKMLHLKMPRMHFLQKSRQHAGSKVSFPDELLKEIKTLTELMIKLVKEEHSLYK
jgi:hypothetical protein